VEVFLREAAALESVVLLALLAFLVGLGYYLAVNKHPVDPHQDFIFELARRCLPKEQETELDEHSDGMGENAGEDLNARHEEPVHPGFG
jgi:hypothetical protein